VAKIITYGIGGFDPTKPNNNIVSEVDGPDDLEPVPDAASPATIRVSLRRLHGVANSQLDSIVDSVIAAIPNPNDQEDARTLWTYSVSIRRDHPLVAAVGQALGLTEAQVDAVFRTAMTV
jgi:hypothetical protein